MEKKQSNRSTEVLAILQQAGEDFVSGEQLCQKLGVSRTAVWKIIKKLKEDGYDIEGVSNRGYRLKEEPEILSREAILTRFHGSWSCAQGECYPVIGSTNDRAKEAYVEGAPHGTLVVADCQKAGKGRRGRQWETPAGAAIAMSSLLRPQLPPEKASMLTLVMALALAQGVSMVTGLEVKIKWPNDLVVNGKKLSGILTEMSADMDEIHYVVIGTGVNVNLEEFPEEIRETATSLYLETGKRWNRAEIIARTMEMFEPLYETFEQAKSLAPLKAPYEALLANMNQGVRVLAGENSYTGIARGIDESGCLLVEREDGSVDTVMSGEVSVRGIYGYV